MSSPMMDRIAMESRRWTWGELALAVVAACVAAAFVAGVCL